MFQVQQPVHTKGTSAGRWISARVRGAALLAVILATPYSQVITGLSDSPGSPILERGQANYSTTRQELLKALEGAEANNAQYLADNTHSVASERLAASYKATKLRFEALPDGLIVQNIPMMLMRRQSKTAGTGAVNAFAAGTTGFSVWTYNAVGGAQVDPITNYVANAPGYGTGIGTWWNISWDLKNSPISPWVDASGSRQYAYICTDGLCQWQLDDWQLQLPPVLGGTAPRYHTRLFGSQYDTLDGFRFTIADAHHDNAGHNCTDDWDNARGNFHSPISWYSSIFNTSNSGNGGWIQCAYHDGLQYNDWITQ